MPKMKRMRMSGSGSPLSTKKHIHYESDSENESEMQYRRQQRKDKRCVKRGRATPTRAKLMLKHGAPASPGNGGSGDHHTTSRRIQLTMKERYGNITSIGEYDGHFPLSYCYIDDCDQPPQLEDHFKIAIFQAVGNILPSWCRNTWKSLPSHIKLELLCILTTFSELWMEIEYGGDAWQDRMTVDDEQNIEEFDLKIYGDPDPSGKSFFELLLGDTPLENLEKEFHCESPDSLSSSLPRLRLELIKFLELWSKGLLKKMTNGVGRHVIMRTLEMIASLVGFLPPSVVPKHCSLHVEHISSVAPNDGFAISNCGSRSLTRSHSTSSLSSTSEPKKKSSDSQHGTGSTSDPKSPEVKKTSKQKSGLPKHSRHFVDLEVICTDTERAEGKYILLVEIFSHGNSYTSALGKLEKELVHVLQGQTEVFGLFVSEREMQLLKVKRNFDNQTITITSCPYLMHSLHEDRIVQEVAVEAFQKFIMDTFSCFVYGISHIQT